MPPRRPFRLNGAALRASPGSTPAGAAKPIPRPDGVNFRYPGGAKWSDRKGPGRASEITMAIFQSWAEGRGLKRSETAYLARTAGPRRELRFSKSGNPAIENAYRTHYVSPALSETKKKKIEEKLSKPPDLVVFSIVRESRCAECQAELAPGTHPSYGSRAAAMPGVREVGSSGLSAERVRDAHSPRPQAV